MDSDLIVLIIAIFLIFVFFILYLKKNILKSSSNRESIIREFLEQNGFDVREVIKTILGFKTKYIVGIRAFNNFALAIGNWTENRNKTLYYYWGIFILLRNDIGNFTIKKRDFLSIFEGKCIKYNDKEIDKKFTIKSKNEEWFQRTFSYSVIMDIANQFDKIESIKTVKRLPLPVKDINEFEAFYTEKFVLIKKQEKIEKATNLNEIVGLAEYLGKILARSYF